MDISLYTETFQVEDRSWLASRDGTAFTQTITLDVTKFTAATHYPNGYIPSGIVLARLTASGLYAPYGGNTAEVQTVTITGGPTGGTFTLTFKGDTTAGIASNATAAQVQAALEALPSIDVGDVTVTGGPGPAAAFTVTFGGKLLGDQPQMTASGTGLTGGTTPAVAVATTVAGGSAVTDGSQTAAGFLFNSTKVRTGGAVRLGAPLHWRGAVRVSRLPANNGLDATAQSQLAAKFLFR